MALFHVENKVRGVWVATYQGLARKYRPLRLKDVVGQPILVDTLTRALQEDRLPHAILFHGTRGVGKTTTARILAKALNCIAETREQMEPCCACGPCLAMAEGRFFDVIEMDAASHTSVDDVREVIEASRYKALEGKYKVYIIDEVHMLSKSAFNALLKTLEEPPPFVKFIFATTELRKVPDTILSRCMRFDLRRLDAETLAQHLLSIAQQENLTLDPAAALLLGQAGDGSARDALSLLDQSIALFGTQIQPESIRAMLGMADRQHILKLIRWALEGQAGQALELLKDLFKNGTDPLLLLEDLLDTVYNITCLKVSPQGKSKIPWSQNDLQEAQDLAKMADLSLLSQTWQVLNRGYEEVHRASLPQQALEMVLIRLCYLAPLPTAHQLLAGGHKPISLPSPPPAPLASASPMPVLPQPIAEKVQSFDTVMALLRDAREPILYGHMLHDVHLVSFKSGEISLRVRPEAPGNLAVLLRQFLESQTKTSWIIQLTDEEGQATLAKQQEKQRQIDEEASREDSTVQSLLSAFPGATLQVENI